MRPALLAAVFALVAVNVLYAFSVAGALDAANPSRPHGLRDSVGPSTTTPFAWVDVTEASGIDVRRAAWTLPVAYPTVITGGVAAADVDGDGRTDLYFPPGGPGHPARMYRNAEDMRFEDVTDAWGLNATGTGAGASFADADNDGDADLYVLIDASGHLLLNENGTFRDIAAEAHVDLAGLCAGLCQPSAVTWLDHDRDGDLDLFVVNNLDWRDPELASNGDDYSALIRFGRPQRSVLYENLIDEAPGALLFRDVTLDAGAWDTGKGLGALATDIDQDGRPDILTANDVTPNAYFHGEADGFVDLARSAGLAEVKSGMGLDAGDVDGDGRLDLVVTNFRGDGLSLYLQRPDGSFQYATREAGLGPTFAATGWGVQLFDADLDGDLDLVHAVGRAVPLAPHENDLDHVLFPDLKEDEEDQFFRNDGGRFTQVLDAGDLIDRANSRAVLAVDLDGDGDQDLVRVDLDGAPAKVLRNDGAPTEHGRLVLDLEGTTSNRDGIGARIEARLPDGQVLLREVRAASGFQTGTPATVVLGLGPHQEADVTVHWPSGATTMETLPSGHHVLVEGQG